MPFLRRTDSELALLATRANSSVAKRVVVIVSTLDSRSPIALLNKLIVGFEEELEIFPPPRFFLQGIIAARGRQHKARPDEKLNGG